MLRILKHAPSRRRHELNFHTPQAVPKTLFGHPRNLRSYRSQIPGTIAFNLGIFIMVMTLIFNPVAPLLKIDDTPAVPNQELIVFNTSEAHLRK